MSAAGGDDDAAANEAERLHRLGNEHLSRKDRAEAKRAYEAALALDPNRPATLNNLANLRRDEGAFEEAAELYRRAYDAGARTAALLTNAANNALSLRAWDEAERLARDAVTLHPEREAGHLLLARALTGLGRPSEKVAGVLEHASEVLPNSAAIHDALGLAVGRAGDDERALEHLRRAAALAPEDPRILENFGDAARRSKRFTEARAALRRAYDLRASPDPSKLAATDALVALHLELGECAEAITVAEDAIARLGEQSPPGGAKERLGSTRLVALSYLDTISPATLRAEHASWAREIERARGPDRRGARARASTSRTRVVYVSPDLREHVVTRFLVPVLEAHDRDRVEIVLASRTQEKDETSARLASSERWRWLDLAATSLEEARATVAALEPDVVVDLAGHNSDLVLPMFAPRVAPLGCAWLGYPGTTGLSTIDVRITDADADPPGTEVDFTERVVRLDRPAWAYRPRRLPEVAQTPRRPGCTFGSFNRATKISGAMLRLWVALLDATKDARLVIRSRAARDPVFRSRVRSAFEDVGAGERVEFRGDTETYEEALIGFSDIDVALDTYPYQGTTTTCDALLMGVPVVSLAGPYPASRVSRSLLGAVGLKDLVVDSADGYLRAAQGLALDADRRSSLRGELRDRFLDGPLGDTSGLARALESTFERELAALPRPHPSFA